MNSQQEAKRAALIRGHTQRVGEIAIQWSYIHVVLAVWYSHLVGNPNVAGAMEEWDERKSDHADRKMLAEKLKEKRATAPAEFDSMLWVLEWLNELASIRNGYVHCCVVIRGLPDEPQTAFLDKMHGGTKDPYKQVREKPLESFEAATSDIAALSEFAHRTFNALFAGDQFKPAPPRPELSIQKVFPDAKPKPFNW